MKKWEHCGVLGCTLDLNNQRVDSTRCVYAPRQGILFTFASHPGVVNGYLLEICSLKCFSASGCRGQIHYYYYYYHYHYILNLMIHLICPRVQPRKVNDLLLFPSTRNVLCINCLHCFVYSDCFYKWKINELELELEYFFETQMIYVARNPKDVFTSFYHFNKSDPIFGDSPWEQYFNAAIKGDCKNNFHYFHSHEFSFLSLFP